ncbi:MAG: hypothetical protein KC561_05775 [Myxococcales bacterium]|nr:hypothetical protein [Myxococcales bacterium]
MSRVTHSFPLFLLVFTVLTGCSSEENPTPEVDSPVQSQTPNTNEPNRQGEPQQNRRPVATDGSGAGPSVLGTPTPLSDQEARAIINALREPDVLEIDHLLNRGDVRELTHFGDVLNAGPLEGLEFDESYNALRLGGTDHLGVTLQVWRYPNSRRATERFQRLRETYPISSDSIVVVGDFSFTAEFADIRQLVFLEERLNHVVALACDTEVCPSMDEVVALADRVSRRL